MQNNPKKAGSDPSQREFVLFLHCDWMPLRSKLSPARSQPRWWQEMPSLPPVPCRQGSWPSSALEVTLSSRLKFSLTPSSPCAFAAIGMRLPEPKAAPTFTVGMAQRRGRECLLKA